MLAFFNESVSDSCTPEERKRLLLVEATSPCDVSVGMLAVCTVAALLEAWHPFSRVFHEQTKPRKRRCVSLVNIRLACTAGRVLFPYTNMNTYQLDSQVLTVHIHSLVKFILVLNVFLHALHILLTCFSEWLEYDCLKHHSSFLKNNKLSS